MGNKPEGSGINKGYKYIRPMRQEHRDAISNGRKGIDATWKDKIKDTWSKRQGHSEEITRRWTNRPRGWIIYDMIEDCYIMTDNLDATCKVMGWTKSKLCTIGKYHETGVLRTARLFRNRYDCWKMSVGQRDVALIGSPQFKKYNIYDYTTNSMVFYNVSMPQWCKEHGMLPACMYGTVSGKRKQHKGWFARPTHDDTLHPEHDDRRLDYYKGP